MVDPLATVVHDSVAEDNSFSSQRVTASMLKTRDTNSSPTTRGEISDLTRVLLVREVVENGHVFPAGTSGTVVFRYSRGEGYEVEISADHHAVVTVSARDIEPA